MKPRLYDPAEIAFDNNGIGVLNDAIKCSVSTELNGAYELTLRYPITGLHFKKIAQRSIILAKPDPSTQPQPFRVYRITKPMLGVVTVYARHIAYDLMGVPVSPFTATDITEALNQLNENAATGCSFAFFTDKSTVANMTVSVPTAIWTLLGGSEGSILDVYGGEYEFDRWEVKLWNRRGANRGVTLRYGKNLTTLEQNENCANCYTGVYPYWASIDGELMVLPEKILNAEGTYNYTRILPLDLSEEWEATPTEEQLRTRAETYMSANDIGVPTVSWKIEFVHLEQTEEYKDLGQLEKVLLGDTVTVLFADMDVNATARVVETEYDSILERYNFVTVGSVRSNLAKTIVDQGKEIGSKPSFTTIEQSTTALGKVILGANGGYIRILDTNNDGMPDRLYVADHYEPSEAKNVWRIDNEGWARSKNGYTGDFEVGATLEAGLLAAAVTAAQLVAGYIKSADEGKTFYLDLEQGILQMNATSLTINEKSVEDIVSETISDKGQEDIFNSLTNNDTSQGLILKDGKIYIDTDYATTGTCLRIDAGSGVVEITGDLVVDGNISYSGSLSKA